MGIKKEEKQADEMAQKHIETLIDSGEIKSKGRRAVFSTRKNPDKLIAQLKKRIECEREWKENFRSDFFKEKGKYLTTCWSADEYQISLTDEEAKQVHLNQKVIIVGHLIGYKLQKDTSYPNRVTISLAQVRLKED